MATLVIPNSFSPNSVIQSSQVNANFSAIATEYNSHAVTTDQTKTITASQTFASGIIVSGAGLNVTGNSTFNNNLGVSGQLSGTTLVVSSTAALQAGCGITGGNLTVTGNAVISGGYEFSGNLANPGDTTAAFYNQSGVGPTVSGSQFQLRTGAVPSARLSVDASGNATFTNSLTVAAGGLGVTGNSTITGNLNVTGSITAVTGSNSYVRRTTTLNFTAATDLTLTFAIGATEEWEFEYVLAHTNGSAATASFQVTGPASSTGFFGGVATVQGAPSAVQGAVQVAMGNSLVGFTMNATAGYTQISGYVKGGGTPGNVSILGTVSAGTGVLLVGSRVRYSRIA